MEFETGLHVGPARWPRSLGHRPGAAACPPGPQPVPTVDQGCVVAGLGGDVDGGSFMMDPVQLELVGPDQDG